LKNLRAVKAGTEGDTRNWRGGKGKGRSVYAAKNIWEKGEKNRRTREGQEARKKKNPTVRRESVLELTS